MRVTMAGGGEMDSVKWQVSIDEELHPAFDHLHQACELAACKIMALRAPDGFWHGSSTPQASVLLHRALRAARAADATGDLVDYIAGALQRSAKPKGRGAKLLIAGAAIEILKVK